MDKYLDSLNAVEEQVKRNEEWLDIPMKASTADHLNLDPDPRTAAEDYLRATYDLIVLAFEADLTRVVTYHDGREDGMGFEDNFPKIALGINKGHHTISHDMAEGHWEQWGRYDQWVADQFGHFVKRLAATEDEHGPLIDSTLESPRQLLQHDPQRAQYPAALAGARPWVSSTAPTGATARRSLSNLLLTTLHAAGVKAKSFSDSTGVVPGVLKA